MARPELGTKRVCLNCSTKFYDLGRMPAPCPNCGTMFEIVEAPAAKEVPKKVVEPTVAEPDDEEDEGEIAAEDADLVSLEEAEEDDTDAADDTTTALIEDDDDDVTALVETVDDDDDDT